MQSTSLVLLEDLVGREKGSLFHQGNITMFLYTVVENDSGFMCVQQNRTNVKTMGRVLQ